MDLQLQALPMAYRDARAAYALVSLHDSSISLGQWLQFARRSCTHPQRRAGLIGVRDRRGVIHALFGYRVDSDMHAGKKLCLSNLVIAKMPGSMIDEAVIAGANELAAQLGCRTVTVEHRLNGLSGIRGPCPTASALLARRIGSVSSIRRH